MIRKQLKVKSLEAAEKVMREMNEDYRFDTFDALDFLTLDGAFIGTAMFDGQLEQLRFIRLAGGLKERDKPEKRNTKMHRVCSKRRKKYEGRQGYSPLFEL